MTINSRIYHKYDNISRKAKRQKKRERERERENNNGDSIIKSLYNKCSNILTGDYRRRLEIEFVNVLWIELTQHPNIIRQGVRVSPRTDIPVKIARETGSSGAVRSPRSFNQTITSWFPRSSRSISVGYQNDFADENGPARFRRTREK